MAKVYKSTDKRGHIKWVVDIYRDIDSPVPGITIYLNNTFHDFEALFDILHSIYGISRMIMQR